MSHFTVLVIGDDVEGQLQPFHEFECTGTDDEHVQTIDKTDEYLAKYNADTSRMMRRPDGEYVSAYDDECYRDPTPEEEQTHGTLGLLGTGSSSGLSWHSRDWGDGRGYRAKVHHVPDGWEEVELPTNEVKSFAEFVEDWYGIKTVPFGEEPDLADTHKYGYALTDAVGTVTRAYDRTNPNKKWDWWVVGGRWTGFFLLKPSEDITHPQSIDLGSPGAFGNQPGEHTADSARKCDIDFLAKRDQQGASAGLDWEAVHRIVAGRPVKGWSEVVAEHGLSFDTKTGEAPAGAWAAAREAYHGQPAIRDINADRDVSMMIWDNEAIITLSKDDYVERARRSANNTFAVLMDGVWYERGQMGWWGAVSDEKDLDEWSAEFTKLLDGLPDDALLTVVDCHI